MSWDKVDPKRFGQYLPKVSLTVTSGVGQLSGAVRPRWCCHDDFFLIAYGHTQREAWLNWRAKSLLFTRHPRRNWWNKKDCMAWFKAGCPRTRSYIGNRQVFGYDPVTDELILRG